MRYFLTRLTSLCLLYISALGTATAQADTIPERIYNVSPSRSILPEAPAFVVDYTPTRATVPRDAIGATIPQADVEPIFYHGPCEYLSGREREACAISALQATLTQECLEPQKLIDHRPFVKLRLVIDDQGQLVQAQVLQDDDEMARDLIGTLRESRFVPGQVAGRAATTYYDYTFTYGVAW